MNNNLDTLDLEPTITDLVICALGECIEHETTDIRHGSVHEFDSTSSPTAEVSHE